MPSDRCSPMGSPSISASTGRPAVTVNSRPAQAVEARWPAPVAGHDVGDDGQPAERPVGGDDDGVEDAVVHLRVGHQLETALERAAVADDDGARVPAHRAARLVVVALVVALSPMTPAPPFALTSTRKPRLKSWRSAAEDVGDPADGGLDLLVRAGHDLAVEAEARP